MVHFIPLPKLPSAKETAEVLHLHGFPSNILSDWGPQFVAQLWKAFWDLLGATVSLSWGYHHQTNGQTERLNQDLETGLRCLPSQNPPTWSKIQIWVEYAHNSLPCSSTRLTPFQVAYGFLASIISALQKKVAIPSTLALVCQSWWTWARAQQILLRNSVSYKKVADWHRQRTFLWELSHESWLLIL